MGAGRIASHRSGYRPRLVDLIDLDRRAADGMEAIIAGTPAARWAAPTPCPEWTVRDLVAHVVAGNVKYTGIARGDDWRRGGRRSASVKIPPSSTDAQSR